MALSPELKKLIAARAAPVADEQRYERILGELAADLADFIAEAEGWVDELGQLRPVAESPLASAMKLRDDLYALRDKLNTEDAECLDTLRALEQRRFEIVPQIECERQKGVGAIPFI